MSKSDSNTARTQQPTPLPCTPWCTEDHRGTRAWQVSGHAVDRTCRHDRIRVYEGLEESMEWSVGLIRHTWVEDGKVDHDPVFVEVGGALISVELAESLLKGLTTAVALTKADPSALEAMRQYGYDTGYDDGRSV